eukprot:gene12636-biopygen5209
MLKGARCAGRTETCWGGEKQKRGEVRGPQRGIASADASPPSEGLVAERLNLIHDASPPSEGWAAEICGGGKGGERHSVAYILAYTRWRSRMISRKRALDDIAVGRLL